MKRILSGHLEGHQPVAPLEAPVSMLCDPTTTGASIEESSVSTPDLCFHASPLPLLVWVTSVDNLGPGHQWVIHVTSGNLCLPQTLHIEVKNHYISKNQIASTLHLLCKLPMGKFENYSSSLVFYTRFQTAQPSVKPQGTKMRMEAESEEGLTLSSD